MNPFLSISSVALKFCTGLERNGSGLSILASASILEAARILEYSSPPQVSADSQ